MKLHFLGAAREVTGSCFLVEALNVRFLVDCGMVQGGRTAAARNHEPFPFDPASIDFVLLTHAHIDHSGLLPKLTRAGFKGAIYATPATVDLLGVMLPDSAHIQESDAKRNAQRLRGKDALPPLYTLQDASDCLQQVRGIEYDREFAPRVGVRARFRDAGHILGSAIIEVWVTEHGDPTKLVFSGDLGQPGRPILRDPTTIEDADILVIESTYGNRQHKDFSATEEEMIGIVEKTLFERGGNVIVPAFAVGRTQEILYHLHRLTCEGRLRQPKVFVDSPMATQATRITREHLELFDEQAKRLGRAHGSGAAPGSGVRPVGCVPRPGGQWHRAGRHGGLAGRRHRSRAARGRRAVGRRGLDTHCRRWPLDRGPASRAASSQVRLQQLAAGGARVPPVRASLP